jgi:hypothetical protein
MKCEKKSLSGLVALTAYLSVEYYMLMVNKYIHLKSKTELHVTSVPVHTNLR